MDWLTFITEITKSLAWPICALIIFLNFKTHLANLLQGIKLRSIKKGEFQADFDNMAEEIREDLPKKGTVSTEDNPFKSVESEIEKYITTSPVRAITQAWNQVEGMVNSVAVRNNISRSTIGSTLEVMTSKGLITSATKDSINGLQRLRNLAVHGPANEITPKKAREFFVMSEAAIWSMQENIKKSTIGK